MPKYLAMNGKNQLHRLRDDCDIHNCWSIPVNMLSLRIVKNKYRGKNQIDFFSRFFLFQTPCTRGLSWINFNSRLFLFCFVCFCLVFVFVLFLLCFVLFLFCLVFVLFCFWFLLLLFFLFCFLFLFLFLFLFCFCFFFCLFVCFCFVLFFFCFPEVGLCLFTCRTQKKERWKFLTYHSSNHPPLNQICSNDFLYAHPVNYLAHRQNRHHGFDLNLCKIYLTPSWKTHSSTCRTGSTVQILVNI